MIRTLLAATSCVPAAEKAVFLTSNSTEAPYGSSSAGLKTRTLSFSANETDPAIALPPIDAENAAFVLLRSIGRVKRTDNVAARSTFVVPWTGRKRTTLGGAVVATSSVGLAASGAPAASTMPTRLTVYGVAGARGVDGVKTKADPPKGAWATSSVPASGGLIVKAARTAPSSTG